jgi:hypothetical protein
MTVIKLPLPGTTHEGARRVRRTGTTETAGCTPHLGALYIFALLRTGDGTTACAAVRFAVAEVSDEPTITDATPSELWAILADTIQNYGGWNVTDGDRSPTLGRAALSDDQRAIMALIGSGLAPKDVAAVMGIGVGTAKRSFDAGVRSLGDALRPRPGTAAETRSSPPGRHLRLL